MAEGDGRVFLVGEREETGRPGQGPRYIAPVQPWGPEWATQTHRNHVPGHHLFSKYIFSVQLHARNTAVIKTALALSSWAHSLVGADRPIPRQWQTRMGSPRALGA